jgi:hypothetical protein
MDFQKLVLIIGAIVLVIFLFAMWLLIRNAAKKYKFPPITSQCPDYWVNTGANQCSNAKNLGTCSEKVMDFSTTAYQGSKGNVAKCKWAKPCGLVWDGITNANLC